MSNQKKPFIDYSTGYNSRRNKRRPKNSPYLTMLLLIVILGLFTFGAIWLLFDDGLTVDDLSQNLQPISELSKDTSHNSTRNGAITIEAEATSTQASLVLPKASLTITPTPSKQYALVEPPVSSASNDLLEQAQTAYQAALTNQDPLQAELALDILDAIEASTDSIASEVLSLRSKILFILDSFNGTVYLNIKNIKRWELKKSDGNRLSAPMDFSIGSEKLFFIDSGSLHQADISMLGEARDDLLLTEILNLRDSISGYPIKEIVAVEATNMDNQIVVLDKSNDIYRYELDNQTWYLEQPQSSNYSEPAPVYINIASYLNRLYLLDPARNQIWRHPANELGIEFLPGTLPWLLKPDDPDVSNGIDLTIDGHIYVLHRNGDVVTYDPKEGTRFNINKADNMSHIEGFMNLPAYPTAIFTNVDSPNLYVADSGRRRIIIFNRHNGELIQQLIAPNNLDFSHIRAISVHKDDLYILAGDHLYSYDLNHSNLNYPPQEQGLPIFQPLPFSTLLPNQLSPNDPQIPLILSQDSFTMPIQSAYLPDRPAIYPGSRRSYRYGVHEGLDFFTKDAGVEIKIGTPVYAASNGTIIRADTNYQEMTLTEINELLATAIESHVTHPEALDKLNGQQIWIDHGNGVATRYSHLSDIVIGLEEGHYVEKGQLIGYVGLSGTQDAITGNALFPHLHFEIRLGPEYQYYLGQWLSTNETRRAYELIFNVPVKPAYSDVH